MKKVLLTSIFTFCIALLFANNGNDSDSKSAIVTQKIEGKIIDRNTNEALAGVALMLNNGGEKYYTDFEGNFSIDNLAPGMYNINILYLSYEGVTLENISTKESGLKLKVELESISH